MAELIDITGSVFGRLTVRERAENTKLGMARWLCDCSCGSVATVSGGSLRSLQTRSCGCLHREISKSVNTKHNMTNTKEHSTWANIKDRCTNPKNKRTTTYFGLLCPEWMSFDRFFSDMGYAPSQLHSIDRKDNAKGYNKENCRWATQHEQQNNRTNNRYLTLNGDRLTVSEWAIRIGISANVIHTRIYRGWSDKDALTVPVRKLTR